MFSNIITLNQLPLNQRGIIAELNCNHSIKTRLFDLGLIPGTIITPVFTSPFGDPTAYEFRNTVISIRDDVSILITIKKDGS